MAAVKISDVTDDIIAEHCKASPEDPLLRVYWGAAVSAVLGRTGLGADEADEHDDLTVAALALTRDMLDNPSYHIDSDKANKLVDGILGLHDHNLLPGVASDGG